MKKSKKRNYIIEAIILCFIIFLKFTIDNRPDLSITVSLFFWLILSIITYLICGLPRIKNYLNKISIRFVIISLLFYLIVVFLLGLFTGFLKAVYSYDFVNIMKNIIPITILILSKELIRFILCKNSNNKTLIIITVLYILFDIILKNNDFSLNTNSQIFTFVFLVCLPTIAKETLCTYMTSKVSLLPTIIYILAFELAVFILPIYPDLGNYLNSVIGLLFPYFVYKSISKLIKYNKKDDLNIKKHYFLIFLVPIIIFISTIIILISGIFSYKIIAIGSDSMNPIYYKGDAVIYKKTEIKNIKEKDILVFNYNGTIITHRVKKIIIKNDRIYYQTKGDNNKNVDSVLIDSKDVLGTVKYIVKYIGNPTIWMQETFKGRRK